MYRRCVHEGANQPPSVLTVPDYYGNIRATRTLSIKFRIAGSGAGFVYNSKLKDLLLRRYRAGIRTRFVLDKSITRFLIFHKLNREFGEELELV